MFTSSPLETLPEDASYEPLQEEAGILAALKEAEADIREDRVVTREEAKRRLAQWISSGVGLTGRWPT